MDTHLAILDVLDKSPEPTAFQRRRLELLLRSRVVSAFVVTAWRTAWSSRG